MAIERQVTDLQTQKRNRERVNIYLDGAFAFGLAGSLAVGLRVGDRLSDKEIGELKRKDSVEEARRRAMRLIARRPRSEQELRRYFERREIPSSVQEAAIEELKDGDWVDDWAFAEAWVENRMAFRPRGAYALKSELRQKGVPREAIEDALVGFDEERAAIKAGRAALDRYADLSWQDFRKRLGGYLGRRGFPFEMISSVVDLLWREITEPESEEIE